MQENEYFRGQMLMMHRTTEQNTAPTTPYAQYFAKKTRRWELRLQGAGHAFMTSGPRSLIHA